MIASPCNYSPPVFLYTTESIELKFCGKVQNIRINSCYVRGIRDFAENVFN